MGAYNARRKPELYLGIFPIQGFVCFGAGLILAYIANDKSATVAASVLEWGLAAVCVLASFVIAWKADDLPYLPLYWQTWKEERARTREGVEDE